MTNNTCTMYYYTTNGDWRQEDCTQHLGDPDTWYYGISNASVWHNTSISEELPYIWSFWEQNYQDSIDWSTHDDLDW